MGGGLEARGVGGWGLRGERGWVGGGLEARVVGGILNMQNDHRND